ncbi:MAG TPA: hypothetical protein VGD90_08860 [Sphingobacteriaceae bacterium]
MNQTHVHLMVTHLPILGPFFGAIVLGYGIRMGSSTTKKAAYILFILSAVGAVISYLTGEAAEETIKEIITSTENTIEPHEEFAVYALSSLILLGILSSIGLLVKFKSRTVSRNLAVAILTLSLMSFAMMAWTGYLGGKIRHTELQKQPVTIPENQDPDQTR